MNLRKIGKLLTRPDLFFFALIWMMVILIAGTVAQKYVGLYQAQKQYFFSYIWWIGPVPTPGGYTTMGVIYLNLFVKLIFASPWSWSKTGNIIVHLGALLLLTGGFLTAVFSQEGNMVIYEGGSSNTFEDYHEKELVVENASSLQQVVSFPWRELKTGHVLTVPGLNFKIEIVKAYRNCEMAKRSVLPNDPSLKEFRGRAKNFDMNNIPLEKEDEKNKSGVMFRVSGAGHNKDGIHFSVDFVNMSPSVDIGDDTYNIALRRKSTQLPFSIKLIHFEKKFYPGTETPRSYKSEVVVIDNGAQWHSVISMNEPLRYKGYTFYQSSFIDSDSQPATILAVVKNVGRMFPYISSIVMCFGLLVHLILNLPKLIKPA